MKESKSVVNERYAQTLELLSIAVGFDRIKKTKGVRLKYPVYLNAEMNETSIDALELSVRATNCLHRYGFRTIGDLVEEINCDEDLKKIRNCGKTSIIEIMVSIMCFQFMQLDKTRQKKYIQRMKELN